MDAKTESDALARPSPPPIADTIWVTGGQQRSVPHWTREWKLYKVAKVVSIAGGRVDCLLEYESPIAHRPDDPTASIVFKAGTIAGNRAYLCTQTEILICDFPSFCILRVVSLPCFNDIHHVAVAADGRLYVAVTGLDAVAELTPDGELIELVSVLGDRVWDRFSPEIDYRKVPTTKPHRSHPNFVFFLDGEPWVTRFAQRDAVPLRRTSASRPDFTLGAEGVHDGLIIGDAIYFTAVNGLVLRFDLKSQARQVIDLNQARNGQAGHPLGWCRGLLPMGNEIWVGFSRIRYTALRQNLDWVRRGFREIDRLPPRPTRLARYDLAQNALVEEVDLEGAGVNAIFSILHG